MALTSLRVNFSRSIWDGCSLLVDLSDKPRSFSDLKCLQIPVTPGHGSELRLLTLCVVKISESAFLALCHAAVCLCVVAGVTSICSFCCSHTHTQSWVNAMLLFVYVPSFLHSSVMQEDPHCWKCTVMKKVLLVWFGGVVRLKSSDVHVRSCRVWLMTGECAVLQNWERTPITPGWVALPFSVPRSVS